MAMATNGGWPAQLSDEPPELPEKIPEHASPLDAAMYYASLALAYAHDRKAFIQALEFLRDAGHNLAFQVGQLGDDVKRLADVRAAVASIPPMRPPLDSQHALIEKGKNETERRVKEEAKKTPGPPTMVDAEEAARISADVYAKLMAADRAAMLARAEQDRVAAELKRLAELDAAAKAAAEAAARAENEARTEAKRLKDEGDAKAKKLKDQADEDARKNRQKLIAIVLSLIGASGLAIVSVAKTYADKAITEKAAERAAGHAEGHAEGVAEVRSLIMPAEEIRGSAPKPTVTAPASVAPAAPAR
jgi:hypothetical protein